MLVRLQYNKQMNKGRFLLFLTLLILPVIVSAQVLVRLEPRHKNVLENKYLRLLDVHISPGDTTLFHIHSTPSFFLTLSNTKVGVQVKGQGWIQSQNVVGESWFQSFLTDTLIHRVTNCDTVPFHVTDLEVLAPYNNSRQIKPLPFEVLFENEKVFAYILSNSSIDQKIISKRGPIIAQLVEGDQIYVHDVKTREIKVIKMGDYLYIKPASSFYLTVPVDRKIKLVLLEIK